MIDMLSSRRRPLSADALIDRAERHERLGQFGDRGFEAPLRMLLKTCAEEGELSLFGRMATRWDVLRFLGNLLRLQHEEGKAPEILDQPVERPIFITGLPRSGTSFLHRLLSEDPANLIPRFWDVMFPYPPLKPGFRGDRRRQTVDWQLRIFRVLAPEFASLHPVRATSPQECSEITAHVFASLRFDTTYQIPSYRRWLDAAGHIEPYRFHKRFLQHLQHQAGGTGRWIVKCPDHIFALAAIRAVYPDARVVFMHRDPLRVLLSVARLTEVVRRPFTRHIDRVAIGRQESDRWLAATELMIDAAERQPFAEPICHLDYQDLVSDPLDTVRRLYHHFGLSLAPTAAARIGRLMEAKPNGGYGAHSYRFEDHGLDAAYERDRFARYLAHFGIRPEDRDQRSAPDVDRPAFAGRRPSTGQAD